MGIENVLLISIRNVMLVSTFEMKPIELKLICYKMCRDLCFFFFQRKWVFSELCKRNGKGEGRMENSRERER